MACIRACVSGSVILGYMLVAVSAMATPADLASVPIGSVLEANQALLSVIPASADATIYDGDYLRTEDKGRLRARLDESQIYLGPDALIETHSIANGFSATLMQGTVAVSSRSGRTFQLKCHGATIRPLSGAATTAQVTCASPSELVLSSAVGGVQVSYDNETQTIEAGTSYRMTFERDDSGPQDNGKQGQPLPVARNKARYKLVAAIVIPSVVVVVLALLSPCRP